MLYWAYGSNLNPRNMKRRCPAAKRVGPLVLDAGSLIFRGVADVTTREGSTVQGGVWRITRDCEQALDQFEGVGNGLYRKKYLELSIKGKREQALYYQMTISRGIMPPAESYLETIRQGYEWFGLDLAALDMALQESWNDKEVTRRLRERHNRRGSPRLARGVVNHVEIYPADHGGRSRGR